MLNEPRAVLRLLVDNISLCSNCIQSIHLLFDLDSLLERLSNLFGLSLHFGLSWP